MCDISRYVLWAKFRSKYVFYNLNTFPRSPYSKTRTLEVSKPTLTPAFEAARNSVEATNHALKHKIGVYFIILFGHKCLCYNLFHILGSPAEIYRVVGSPVHISTGFLIRIYFPPIRDCEPALARAGITSEAKSCSFSIFIHWILDAISLGVHLLNMSPFLGKPFSQFSSWFRDWVITDWVRYSGAFSGIPPFDCLWPVNEIKPPHLGLTVGGSLRLADMTM